MDLVGQSTAGDLAKELLIVVKDCKKDRICKAECTRLENTLHDIIPILDGVFQTGSELSQYRQNLLKELSERLQKGKELGKELLQECLQAGPYDVEQRIMYRNKILYLEKYLASFNSIPDWLHNGFETMEHLIQANIEKVISTTTDPISHREIVISTITDQISHSLREDMRAGFETAGYLIQANREIIISAVTNQIHNLREEMRAGFETTEHQIQAYREIVISTITDQIRQMHIDEEITYSNYDIPELPECTLGLEMLVEDLKKRLISKDDSLVAVKGMGGSGKTTLAVALCKDPKVKEFFKERIIFETVSQSPNLKEIIERMWNKITLEVRPHFHDDEDACTKFKGKLKQMNRRTLIVLDDVWEQHPLENLLCRAEGYKIVITTRSNIGEPKFQYDLQLLSNADALSLFCFWAFRQQTIPETVEDTKLVEQIVAECKGLPLALKVIGSCLRNKCPAVWRNARANLSQAESISNYHKDGLLKCLEMSIKILEEEVRECFLDLGSFPEDRKNSVASLLDLWVYVHGLDWDAAYTNLEMLKDQNLLNLVNNPMDWLGNEYGSSCQLFTQHDVLRDLAIYLTKQGPINRRKRLIMPHRENIVSKTWKRQADCPFDAEIVSFHTDIMNEEDWCQLNFPKAKALVLNFSASEYFLPPFLQTMHRLKVLIIVNHNSKRASLKGLSVLSSLSKLRSVHLERVIVPPLQEYCHSWEKLEKLSLILCEGCGNMNEIDKGLCLNFSHLIELTIDHCPNLEELSDSICNMTSLEKLSVTSCHDLYKLSDDLGKLSSLQMLRLSACPCLKELPYSIGKLRQLKFLDISFCECMRQLPDELGQLSSLRKLDMRECSSVRQLPKSARRLQSLVHVICDKRIGQWWSVIKDFSIPQLNVEVAEEHFHLDWLEY